MLQHYFLESFNREVVEKYLSILKDLAFPKTCCFCGRNLLRNNQIQGICKFCAALLPLRSSSARLHRCIEESMMLKLRYSLNENFSVIVCCHYTNIIRKALLDMKFYEAAHFKEAFGSILALVLEQTGFEFDAIIPIPLHEKRQRERGYNQTSLMAANLSNISGIPVFDDCLIRAYNTARQSETSSKEERIENLTDVFRCINPEKLYNRRVLLLDDVLTSGATLFNAAKAIRQSLREYEKTKDQNENIKDYARVNDKEFCSSNSRFTITGLTMASERK